MRDKSPARLVAEGMKKGTSADRLEIRRPVVRVGLVDLERVGTATIEHWTRDPLIRPRNATPGPFSEVFLDGNSFRSCAWMEQFSAKEVYDLGRSMWPMPSWTIHGGRDPLRQWELGKGPSLLLGTYDSTHRLYRQLLELVLPRVCRVQMSERGGCFVTPMKQGWQETLENWRTFIRDPVHFGPFVEYVGGNIWELLSWEGRGIQYLNSKYSARFAGWRVQELLSLKSALDALVRSKRTGRQVALHERQESALSKAIEAGPELLAGGAHGKWHLRDLPVP
jgi:hypothetical protein